jgi:hypothetical protein
LVHARLVWHRAWRISQQRFVSPTVNGNNRLANAKRAALLRVTRRDGKVTQAEMREKNAFPIQIAVLGATTGSLTRVSSLQPN